MATERKQSRWTWGEPAPLLGYNSPLRSELPPGSTGATTTTTATAAAHPVERRCWPFQLKTLAVSIIKELSETSLCWPLSLKFAGRFGVFRTLCEGYLVAETRKEKQTPKPLLSTCFAMHSQRSFKIIREFHTKYGRACINLSKSLLLAVTPLPAVYG